MLTVHLIHVNNIDERLMKIVPSHIIEKLGELCFTIVAVDEATNNLLGFLVYSSHDSKLKRVSLDYIYVFEEFRNQKVGTKLVNELISKLKSIGITEIEVNLFDYEGPFENALNFFLDCKFNIINDERAVITYSGEEITSNKMLKDSIAKYHSLKEVEGIRVYSDIDSREKFKLETEMGYNSLLQIKKEEDLSFSQFNKNELKALAICRLEENDLLYYVYDTTEDMDKADLARLVIATGVSIKNRPEIQEVSFTISDPRIFQSFMRVFGECEDYMCSQRLLYDISLPRGRS